MDLVKHMQLWLIWRREFARIRAELGWYSKRELTADLRLNRSDIPAIAREAADQSLAAFVRSHPDYRRAWDRRSGHAAAGWNG